MKTKETNSEMRPKGANFSFPCGDLEKMAEMMKNCCPDGGSTFDCCSVMRKMMERGKGGKPERAEETQKTTESGENS